MSRNKKSLGLILLSCIALVGCTNEHKTYPVDYDKPRYNLDGAKGQNHDDLVSGVVANKKIK